MLKGIIFDFDGVIVNSVDSLFSTYYDVIRDLGLSLNNIDISQLNGLTINQICHYINTNYNTGKTLDYLISIYYSKLEAVYDTCDVIPETISLIKYLKDRSIPLSIASGCPDRFIQKTLKKFGLENCFIQIVGGDSILNGKPDPEVFTRCLNNSSFNCALVIDDSNNGTLAALRAGCSSIKFDDFIRKHKRLNEFIEYQFVNNLSYLGEFQIFELDVNEINYQVSEIEQKKWDKLKKDGIYNAPLLVFDSDGTVSMNKLAALLTDYKYYRVKGEKKIALAVTGIVKDSKQNILVGKRSDDSFQYPGRFDLVPAGSLESIDYIAQLNVEWNEETGCDKNVSWSESAIFTIDHNENVFDIVVKGNIGQIELDDLSSSEFKGYQWINAKNLSSNFMTPSGFSLIKYMVDST